MQYKLSNFDDAGVQVLSDKKKRDVYDRFGEEGLKTNNGGGGGGDQQLHLDHHHHHPNLPRVTQWIHVPRGPKADVPAIFWDEQSLRELFQHAWHGIKPTPGWSSLTIVESPFCDILLFC